MLFSPVYTEAHTRRIAIHASSCSPSNFTNPFRSRPFRTLAPHFQAAVSFNSFEIKRFRTLCKIPGIGYPLTLSDWRVFTFSPSPIPPQSLPVIQPFRFQFLTDSLTQWGPPNPFPFNRLRTLFIAMGVYTPHTECLPTRSLAPREFEGRTFDGGRGVNRKDRATRQPNRKSHAPA
jgi:hypothetical protein